MIDQRLHRQVVPVDRDRHHRIDEHQQRFLAQPVVGAALADLRLEF